MALWGPLPHFLGVGLSCASGWIQGGLGWAGSPLALRQAILCQGWASRAHPSGHGPSQCPAPRPGARDPEADCQAQAGGAEAQEPS